MSTTPGNWESGFPRPEPSARAIETIANDLFAFIEDLETKIRGGHIPTEFAQRLSHIRQGAERLFRR